MTWSLNTCEGSRHGGTHPSTQEAGAGGWGVIGHRSQKEKKSDEMLVTTETVRIKVSC